MNVLYLKDCYMHNNIIYPVSKENNHFSRIPTDCSNSGVPKYPTPSKSTFSEDNVQTFMTNIPNL